MNKYIHIGKNSNQFICTLVKKNWIRSSLDESFSNGVCLPSLSINKKRYNVNNIRYISTMTNNLILVPSIIEEYRLGFSKRDFSLFSNPPYLPKVVDDVAADLLTQDKDTPPIVTEEEVYKESGEQLDDVDIYHIHKLRIQN